MQNLLSLNHQWQHNLLQPCGFSFTLEKVFLIYVNFNMVKNPHKKDISTFYSNRIIKGMLGVTNEMLQQTWVLHLRVKSFSTETRKKLLSLLALGKSDINKFHSSPLSAQCLLKHHTHLSEKKKKTGKEDFSIFPCEIFQIPSSFIFHM